MQFVLPAFQDVCRAGITTLISTRHCTSSQQDVTSSATKDATCSLSHWLGLITFSRSAQNLLYPLFVVFLAWWSSEVDFTFIVKMVR